ncbi:MAG: hypothetical protein A2340_16400 [Lentisphaerae bacterium RIFOXYB12_FULL_60_10]|nr:MAG: hypothetical protein A2340_16400 [Lentisphaerae bacterium RIFOXYB12_FULL_60_10]
MKPKAQGIVSWPKAERPRARLLSEGGEDMTETEFREIVVRMGLRHVSGGSDLEGHSCVGNGQ